MGLGLVRVGTVFPSFHLTIFLAIYLLVRARPSLQMSLRFASYRTQFSQLKNIILFIIRQRNPTFDIFGTIEKKLLHVYDVSSCEPQQT